MPPVARAHNDIIERPPTPAPSTATEQRMTKTHSGNSGSHAGRLVLVPTLVLLAQCATAPRKAASNGPAPVAAAQPAPAPNAAEVRLHNDWAYLERYRQANASLPAPAPGENRVVFYGNSITEGWAQYFSSEFP